MDRCAGGARVRAASIEESLVAFGIGEFGQGYMFANNWRTSSNDIVGVAA